MNAQPVTLTGRIVRLEPMTLDHALALALVGLEPELWRLQPKPIQTPDDMRDYVLNALDLQRQGVALPFTIVDQQTGKIIGSTRYLDIASEHRRLEIGATWLSSAYQRTGANTEAKLLLLTHAFETLGAIRVVFKTEVLNLQSRKAIERIGAVEEGIFRKHLIASSGRVRDMVYYAIVDDDWPAVKTRLTGLLR
ncbi:MAG TPA: GNAT family protein [Blastocatellia bacterium]|nr:GNAT family protein [Blastocatellia bacterium]